MKRTPKILSFKQAQEFLASPWAGEDAELNIDGSLPLLAFEIPKAGELDSRLWDSDEKFAQTLLELPAVTCGILDSKTDTGTNNAGTSDGETNNAPENSPVKSALDVILPQTPSEGLDKKDKTDAETDIAADIANLSDKIAKNPVASLTLVQLLRLNQKLSLKDQLIAESLAYSTLQSGEEFKSWLNKRAKSTGSKSDKNKEPAVLVERTSNEITLTLNRPEKHNAFSAEMRDILVEALRTAAADSSISEIYLQANGASFCAGGDLDEFGTAPNPGFAHYIRSVRNTGWMIHQLKDRISVKVHGACVGAGIELPAFASHITAKKDSFFQLPEISLGLIPGAGGTASIPRRIGRQKTVWLALTGEVVNAQTALAWGLIDEIAN